MARILEGRNRPTPSEAASFVDQFEVLEKEIDALKIEHMNKVRKVRQKQSDLLDDAKSQGVPKKVVKAVAQARKYSQKALDAIGELEDDDESYAQDIYSALGDFADSPLGAAAVAREESQDDTTKAIVDAAQQAWDEADPNQKEPA